jgi:predicted nucleic acid-binding protein
VIYADTNILLSLFCEDDSSSAADTWYREVQEQVAISHWSVIEFRSNIGIRVRKKLLSRLKGVAAIGEFDRLAKRSLHFIAPEPRYFETASDWLTRPECALRSGDALHLAIAFGGQCGEFVTFDKPLAAVAKRMSLPVKVLRP